ncbi:YbaB/EbfC family nucleoid-associated protein [Spirillospora sp. CA-253888]
MPVPDPEAPREEIDLIKRLQKHTTAQMDRYRQLQEDLEGITAEAVSADKTVKVIVRAGGSVQDIVLTQQALRHGPERLGRLITSTVQEAAAIASADLENLLQTATGPTVDFTKIMKGDVPGLPSEDPDAYLRSKGITW